MTDGPPPVNSRRPRALRGQIDENLKRLYDDTLDEEVPDRFARLIDRLRAAEDGMPDDREKD